MFLLNLKIPNSYQWKSLLLQYLLPKKARKYNECIRGVADYEHDEGGLRASARYFKYSPTFHLRTLKKSDCSRSQPPGVIGVLVQNYILHSLFFKCWHNDSGPCRLVARRFAACRLVACHFVVCRFAAAAGDESAGD